MTEWIIPGSGNGSRAGRNWVEPYLMIADRSNDFVDARLDYGSDEAAKKRAQSDASAITRGADIVTRHRQNGEKYIGRYGFDTVRHSWVLQIKRIREKENV